MEIRILIVEAEDRFRKSLYPYLQAQGFTVENATLQDDIESIVAMQKIDVVLLGVDGLGREGLALIQPIKAASARTNIIVINDPNRMELSIEAMDLGAFDDFLIPLDIDSLSRRIREATIPADHPQR
jgi:two-component system OmpR family response regulator/two-component system response regulator QseB